MLPQIAWMRRCRVTLAAFVWLFSTVSFQMLPQMACLRRCIVALVAFVWLYSTVCFQMLPQIAWMRRCIVTLCFQMCPGWEEIKSLWLYLFDLSLLCVFKCLLISPAFEDAKSHWVHLFAFSPASQCVFSNCLHQRMRSNTDCICTTSLHQSFWHVSLNYTIHAHTCNIFWASYHFACSFSQCINLNELPKWGWLYVFHAGCFFWFSAAGWNNLNDGRLHNFIFLLANCFQCDSILIRPGRMNWNGTRK